MDKEIILNLRKYGNPPFNVAVIHGGPGAPGSVAPIARELSSEFGVLEPLQTEDTIDGQLEELKMIMDNNQNIPMVLIGHSWGAWLSYMFAVRYPLMVKKLILVGAGSFEERYLRTMNEKRVNRLTEDENQQVAQLFKRISDLDNENRKKELQAFGKLMSKADTYAPICLEEEILDFYPEAFENCMKEINQLRSSKELLYMGKEIACPVVAIHGEYDSHAYEGVKDPLTKVIKDFTFILLDNCGHSPWNEVYAKEEFYHQLRHHITD